MDAKDVSTLAQRAAGVIAAFDTAVPSPCVSVCKMDADRRYCIGCLRTIPEIAGWSKMDDAGRRRIWQAIQMRAHSQQGAEAHP